MLLASPCCSRLSSLWRSRKLAPRSTRVNAQDLRHACARTMSLAVPCNTVAKHRAILNWAAHASRCLASSKAPLLFLFSTLSKPSNQHACMLQVLTGQCPGDATCLTSTGACSAPPPPSSYTWGPDVSSYQGSVAWSSVAASGASFAFAKATEGLTITDSQFAANWAGIAAAGLPRGAYHFGHPCNQGAQEASFFVNAVQAQGVLQSADMLVLDIETPCSNPPDGSIANYCVNFINQVAQLTGSSNLLIYTGAWFWNPNTGGSSALSDYALWVSGYTSSPPMPGGWNSWTYWQYTDLNSVSGISGNVDSSYHPHPPYPSFCVCRSFCALFVDAPVQVFLGHRR